MTPPLTRAILDAMLLSAARDSREVLWTWRRLMQMTQPATGITIRSMN